MIHLEDELAADYLAECHERLVSIEADLLLLKNGGSEPDREAVSRVFRSLHWVQGGAGVFDLSNVGALARQMEQVLALTRSRGLSLTKEAITLLVSATDRLRDLIQDPLSSDQADIARLMSALMMLNPDRARHPSAGGYDASIQSAAADAGRLRALLVEDDFASRLVLSAFLSKYGECHIAVNGREAVEAFRAALDHGTRYDLVCMDIMMPEMDGREAVRRIRTLEEERGILSTFGARIVMTTAVDDVKEVIRCFHELCDSYLVKPIDLAQLVSRMRAYKLIS